MVSSPNVLPEPGVPRRVTVLTIWTVSDTLSVLATAWQLMSTLPALLEGTEKDAWGHRRLAWHVMCRDVEEDVHSSTNIRQEGQGYMATPAPMLLVDGNPQMMAMLQRFLARQQVDAQAVLSPVEAQAVLAQQPLRVVLTDYFAPSGDGLALLRSLRQTVSDTRGILMAAFGAPELWRAALTEGAYACLAKPFRLHDLWAIVQPALQGLPAPEASRRSDQGGLGQPSRG